jgi:hypothetical protein
MIGEPASTCLAPPEAGITEELTGFPVPGEDTLPRGDRVARPPMSMAWISDPLLEQTVEVWSEAYRRPVSKTEAVEILMNVKRLGEVLLRVRKEENPP